MKLAPILALVALGSPAFAQAPPCDGVYEFFSGKNTIKVAPGNSMHDAERVARAYNNREGLLAAIIPNPRSEGLHEVKVSQCGRQFVLTQGGKRMVFLQSVMDDSLYVAQDIGTEKAELTVRVVDHKFMVGEVAGESHGYKFRFPLVMEPREIAPPDMKGCDDARQPDEEEGTQTTGAQGLTGALALQGKAPAPGYGLSDYVLASTAADGSQKTWLNLSMEGKILPAEPPTPDMVRICTTDGRSLIDPPRYRLNFKQKAVEDGIYVFVQVIEIETGKILEQREGFAASPAPADRAQAMNTAWSKLDFSVGAPSDGYSGG